MRIFSFLFALILSAGVGSGLAQAQDGYPKAPINLIVGFNPGGGSDVSARILAEGLSEKLGQPVVVENKPGGGSMIGVDFVAKSAPDGYTLLHTNSDGISILTAVRKHTPYTVPDDFDFITRILYVPLAVVVNAKLPITSMKELVEYAKANSGRLRYGTSGVGTGPHLSALLLQKEAEIKWVHAPYQGTGPMLNDMLGGHIDVGLPAVTQIAKHADSDTVRIIAVTGPKRSPLMPDVPTLAEAGLPGAEMIVWYGLLAPTGLPKDVLARLREASTEVLNDPKIVERYTTAGFELAPLVGDEFEAAVIKEHDEFKALAKAEGIAIE